MTNVIQLRSRQRVDPAHEWRPAPGECLACFVHRMVMRCSCTGTLVWAEHWRRMRSPRASALIRRLEGQGAVCDCALTSLLWSPTAGRWDAQDEEALAPSCAGVRPRSVRPCGLWSALSRPAG